MAITTLLRRANSTASSQHGIGGALKRRYRPAPITLPKLRCLEDGEQR
jgi:hypothetical protein